jgi:ubiquinone/menaquinone biosynthesis C-methylase UbiE
MTLAFIRLPSPMQKEDPMSQHESWQVAGNAAEVYERYLVPAVFQPWAPRLLALVAPQPGERVLDVACGTGVVARLAAAQVGTTGTVRGLDVNPGMLAVARSLPSPEGATIEWHEGNATSLPFPDASFDVVCCQLGLQFFPDRPAALREMARVLVPGGRLALLVWRAIHHSPGFAVLADALEQHISAAAAALMRAPFAFGDTEDELRSLLTEAGFRMVVIRAEVGTVRFTSPEALVQYYIAGSPLAGHVSSAREEARAALIPTVQSALQPYVHDDRLAFPIEGHLVAARR